MNKLLPFAVLIAACVAAVVIFGYISRNPDGSAAVAMEQALIGAPGVVAEQGVSMTQILDDAGTVSGTLSVTNQQEGFSTSCPTSLVSLTAGPYLVLLKNISMTGWDEADPQPDPPAGTDATWVTAFYYVADEDHPGDITLLDHEFVYFDTADPAPWDIEVNYSVSVTDQQLAPGADVVDKTSRASVGAWSHSNSGDNIASVVGCLFGLTQVDRGGPR